MLTYKVIGSSPDGRSVVGYSTEEGDKAVLPCKSTEQAHFEAGRLNILQFMRQEAVRHDLGSVGA